MTLNALIGLRGTTGHGYVGNACFVWTSTGAHALIIVTMSAAWHGGIAGEEQWVNDSSLAAAISSAMNYWFANDFTVAACLDEGGTDECPCGTPGLWNTNWFSNVGK